MKQIKDREALLWLVAVLLSLILGQWMLSRALAAGRPDQPPWMAVVILLMGAVALWMGRRLAEAEQALPLPVSEPVENPQWALGLVSYQQLERHWRPAALLLALGLTFFVLWRIPRLQPFDSYLGVFLAWLLAAILLLAAVAEPRQGPWAWRTWLKERRWLLLAVAAILLGAFLLRVWRLSTLPFTLGGDEASQGLEAVRVLRGELRNPFTTGWLGVPTMSFFYNSVALHFFGRTIFALRLPWVIVGTATVLSTFLLVRQLLGVRLALITAVLLATYHYHIHYSRLGSNQVADPLFLALALFFLYRALDGHRRLDWALVGLVTGLAFYFYAGARLTPLVLLLVLAYLFVLERRAFWQAHHRGLLVAVVAFVIVAAPMLQYAARFPNDFNARLNEVGIIQSGWLEQEMLNRGLPLWAVLFDQFQRAFLAFNYYADRTVWYGLREPLLDPFFGGLFLLGLLYATLKLFTPIAGRRLVPMLAWWWAGMVLGGVLTESPPSSQRLITLAVPACFFVAWALWEIVLLARQAAPRVPAEALIGIGVLLFAVMSLTTYFVDFTPQRLYGGQNAELATQIAPRLNELKAKHRFYFLGAPWMYWGFATLPYLVPDAQAMDILEPLAGQLSPDLLPGQEGAVFILIPPRMAELQQLMEEFPEGVREDVYSPVDGRHMGTLYRVGS